MEQAVDSTAANAFGGTEPKPLYYIVRIAILLHSSS